VHDILSVHIECTHVECTLILSVPSYEVAPLYELSEPHTECTLIWGSLRLPLCEHLKLRQLGYFYMSHLVYVYMKVIGCTLVWVFEMTSVGVLLYKSLSLCLYEALNEGTFIWACENTYTKYLHRYVHMHTYSTHRGCTIWKTYPLLPESNTQGLRNLTHMLTCSPRLIFRRSGPPACLKHMLCEF